MCIRDSLQFFRGMTNLEYNQQSPTAHSNINLQAYAIVDYSASGGYNWRAATKACEGDGTSDWRPVSNYLMCCDADIILRPNAWSACAGPWSDGWAATGHGLYPEGICAWRTGGTTQWYALADSYDGSVAATTNDYMALVCYNADVIDADAQDATAAANSQAQYELSLIHI